jgi:CubicO group peptidase (beta-lactamase class C family)
MLRRTSLILLMIAGISSSALAQQLTDDPRVSAALNLLEVWLDAEQAYEDIPGLSMAVVHDQEVLWSGAFGYADRARMAPATPKTLYSICSISKLFTSIGVMRLRDEGKLHLDDPVGEHLSWFDIEQRYPDSSPITVERLLTHSAGLPRESDFPYWTPDFDFPTREMVIERLGSQETLYPAAKYFQYSNLGLTLAGEILAATSGQSYAEYMNSNILEPLGLDDTTPEIPADQRGARFATGYGSPGRDGERSELAFFQVRGIAPAAGFASTVEDLAAFASWQFRVLEGDDDEVLSANTLREMQRVQWVDPDWEIHWGLGLVRTSTPGSPIRSWGRPSPGRSNPRKKLSLTT